MTGTPAFDTDGVVHLHLERNAADLEWHAFLTDWDVLLTPTWTHRRSAHGADLASADGALAVLQHAASGAAGQPARPPGGRRARAASSTACPSAPSSRPAASPT